jgi:hypothetical protein
MDGRHFFGDTHLSDPFEGIARPSSYVGNAFDRYNMSPYAGHAVAPPSVDTSRTNTAVIVLAVLLFLTLVGAAILFFKKEGSMHVSEATAFTASVASIVDPRRRAEAEALNRAYSAANTEAARAAIRQALVATLGGSAPPPRAEHAPRGASTAQPMGYSGGGTQQPPAEPPSIHLAPEGDPNFVRVY